MIRFVILILLQAAPACWAGELWISPRGSDEAPGSKAMPMATLERALARDPSAHIRVEAGTYPLNRTVVLGPGNSGAVIEAADAKSPPIFVGARRITGFTALGDGLWRARADFRFEQLWVNGRRAVRARTPNEDWLYAAGPVGYGTDPQTGVAGDLSRKAFRAAAADAAPLLKLAADDLKAVQVVVWHAWSVSQHGLLTVQPSAGASTLKLSGPSLWPFFRFGPTQRYHLENFLEALDAPGEWFQARDGLVYYRPRAGEDMASAVVMAPVLSKFVSVAGANNVTLRWLRFHYSGHTMPEAGVPGLQAAAEADASITVSKAQGVRLQNLEIAHTGQYGVWFRQETRDSALEHCLLEDLGAGGVRIGETGRAPEAGAQAAGITILNNIIRDGGHVFPGAVGVLVGHASNNRIAANDISGFLYSGVSVGWIWGYGPNLAVGNVVEGNHIHHLGFGKLSDMAGIYTLGVSPGTEVRGNVIHDVLSYDQYGRGGWGIYLDEGSSEVLIENNLVYRTKSGGFHQYYGRNNTVRNNIFAFGRDAQLQRTRVEPHLSFSFTRNIVVAAGTPLLYGRWDDGNAVVDWNLYHDTTGAELYWGKLNLRRWQESGRDANSVIADPEFVNVRDDDYRLRPSSPALELGFVPLKPAGVEGDESWRAAAAAVRYPAMKQPPIAVPAQPIEVKEDFEKQPPGTPPSFTTVITEGKGDSIGTTAERALGGRHSLKMQDAAGLAHPHNPHFYYQPNHTLGITTVRFAVYLEPGAKFWHEWRDAAAPYRVGPSLTIRDGKLRASGKDVATLASNEWIRVEISAALGTGQSGSWKLSVTPGNGRIQSFVLPNHDKAWHALAWLGFVSNDTGPSALYIDDVEITNSQSSQPRLLERAR